MKHQIVFDIETSGHPCAAEFIEVPDLDSITAAKNLKDPDKIAADIDKRKADAIADYQQRLQRAALDWNVARIVAIGYTDPDDSITAITCDDEASEAAALQAFWKAARERTFIGFAARTFDLPMLIQRSRLLRVNYPYVSLGRYGKGDVLDLRDILTFDDARYEAVMPRSLKAFCRRFGIPVTDEIGGAEIPQLVADGNWAAVLEHVTSDVRLTLALAQRLRLVPETVAA